MNIQLIQVPYDSGYRSVRMGRGPEYFVQHGVDEALRGHGWSVHVETIEAQRPFRAEIFTAFELCYQLARRVQVAKQQGAFPIVLSGNCSSCLGTISGIDPAGLGIIWFDAHCDFHTPETTASGFFDGMGLAIATGHCWTTIAKGVPGFVPVPENQVVLIGTRQSDVEEHLDRLRQSQVTLMTGEQVRSIGIKASLAEALKALRSRVQRVYVHIDLDVFDSQQVGHANSYAEPNGLSVYDMEEAIAMIAQLFVIDAVGFASYDPDFDTDERVFRAGRSLMEYTLQVR